MAYLWRPQTAVSAAGRNDVSGNPTEAVGGSVGLAAGLSVSAV